MEKTTEYSKIYDHFYKDFANQINYKITNGTKAKIIDEIFQDLSWEDQQAIRAQARYYSWDMASKNVGISKRDLMKQYETAKKHMYWPGHIAKAVHNYYKEKHQTPLTEADFQGKKYILNALKKKSGIIYREQLLKHLSNGYYYLWTIPGCGENARMTILMAVDKWTGRI